MFRKSWNDLITTKLTISLVIGEKNYKLRVKPGLVRVRVILLSLFFIFCFFQDVSFFTVQIVDKETCCICENDFNVTFFVWYFSMNIFCVLFILFHFIHLFQIAYRLQLDGWFSIHKIILRCWRLMKSCGLYM